MYIYWVTYYLQGSLCKSVISVNKKLNTKENVELLERGMTLKCSKRKSIRRVSLIAVTELESSDKIHLNIII